MHTQDQKRQQFNDVLSQTEGKFGRGPSDNWKNRDFEDLSFEINRKSKILISTATLKRMFGKVKTASDYFPQEGTIEALKIYSDYQGNIYSSRPISKTRRFVAPAALFVVFVCALIYTLYKPESKIPAGACKLMLTKVEGHGPATASFTYSVPETKDSLFLDFGDESNPLNIGAGREHFFSHFYAYPGLFYATIKDIKGQILSDSVSVYVPTRDWEVYAHYFKPNSRDRYYPVPLETNCDSFFHVNRKALASLGLDSTEIIVVRIDNFKKTDSDGDNFSYLSRFRNSTFWPAVRCFSVYFTIQGSTGKILFKFVGDGCSIYSQYQVGEKTAQGTTNDLKNFVMNTNVWNVVRIENRNKNVEVFLNSALIFKETYAKSIGNIIGTTVLFHGSGWLDHIRLSDADGRMVFSNEF